MTENIKNEIYRRALMKVHVVSLRKDVLTRENTIFKLCAIRKVNRIYTAHPSTPGFPFSKVPLGGDLVALSANVSFRYQETRKSLQNPLPNERTLQGTRFPESGSRTP